MKCLSLQALFLLGCLLPLASGCTTLKFPGSSLLPGLQGTKAKVAVDDQAVPDSQTVVVELYRVNGLAGRVRVPVKPGMVVQNVLEDSGALDRFSRMSIKLKRRVDGQQGYLPLTAVYDHGRKTVRPESNYAIRPGDFLIVTEDPTTSTDEMVQQLLNPLGI